jgi:mannose-1-phosphate guanylyltransferase/phosphomannomutase
VKAVVMAGGFGTRLRPLTCNLPKPMVPVAGKPMMEHVINLLKRHDFRELVVLLYFQVEEIKNYFGSGAGFGVRIEYVKAEDDYGTAGSVKNAEELLGDRFLIISGDVLTDFDLGKVVDFHVAQDAKATMVLTRVENPLAYGVVITDEGGRITRFLEKPSWGQVFSDTINTGIYVLEKEVLQAVPPKTEFDFSRELFPGLLKRGESLFGYVAEGYWKDIGDVNEYFRCHQDILEGRLSLELDGNLLKRSEAQIWVGRNVEVGQEVEFRGTVIIGEEVKIKPHSKVSNSVIGSGSDLGVGSVVNGSIIWRRAKIGDGVIINEAVVGNDSVLEEGVSLEVNAIVGDNCHLERGSQIKANVKLWPDKRVGPESIISSSLVWGEAWNRELFTDSKVSGTGNVELTPEFAAKLGAAFGAFLGKGSMVISSRDAGRSSRMVDRAIISGLLSAGVNVQDLRTLPIPVLRFVLRSGGESGGFHVRRSPVEDKSVDIIFFGGDGKDLPTSKCKAIERLFFREDFRRATVYETGAIDFPQRVIENYRQEFLKNIDIEAVRSARFKVVVDYSHGGATQVFPSIFSGLGLDLVSLNAYLDPSARFRTEADFQQSIRQLASIGRSLGADVGFLLDAGAEKLSVVDEKGDFIDSDRLLPIVTSLYLQSHQAQRVAVPVPASMGVDIIAGEYGVRVFRTRNDHLAMMEAMQAQEVDFVGGTKGGFIFPGFQLGTDAMFAVVKILELMAKSQTRLGEVGGRWSRLKMVRRRVPCPWVKKGRVMRQLLQFTADSKRELIDGVRVVGDDSWVLVIPDRREAFFEVIAESWEKRQAEELVESFSRRLLEWQE